MSLSSTEILAKLKGEPVPLSFAKLKAAFAGKKSGNSEADLQAALDNGLRGGTIFAWPKKSYWHVDPQAQLRAEILKLCGEKALKKTEIKIKPRGPKDLGAAVDQLVADKQLIKYPALTGSAVLFVAAHSPQAYWAYVRAFVADKLKKAGIEEVALDENLLEQLVKLESEKDVPVSVGRLRSVSSMDKQGFDDAMLKLQAQRLVHLSQHDDPWGLSAEDRAALIDGKDGRYYVAITRRG